MKLSLQFPFFHMNIIFLVILLHNSIEANEYEECKGPFLCGKVNISYPFYDEETRPAHCGYPGFKLDCSDDYDGYPEISVTNSSEKYLLLKMNSSSHTISVARKDFWNSICTDYLFNTSLNYGLYEYPYTVQNFTLYYDCPARLPSTPSIFSFPCPNNQFYVTTDDYEYNPLQCQSNIVVPLDNHSLDTVRNIATLQNAFRDGFHLEWTAENLLCDQCRESNGECGYNFSQEKVTCYHVLYGCPPPYTPNPSQFTCKIYGTNDTDGYPVEGTIGPSGCFASIVVPVIDSSAAQIGKWGLSQIIGKGFEAMYKVQGEDICLGCEASKGRCGFDVSKNKVSCLCLDGSVGDAPCNNSASSAKSGPSHQTKLKTTLIIIAASVSGLALVAAALLFFTRTKTSQVLILTKEERKDSQDVEVMLKRYGEYAPRRYTYGEIKKMTSCFQEKLGEGGYGGVYKGKLQDGSPVAVKLLKNPNFKGTDFINEVASISETNHVNVVTLLGYCYQGRKRALVYDFLPNGSLDKYLYCGQNQNSLSWETLLQIAIGIGRGLEYLHQGCRTRILHFDIKPHNILLDAKFCPKISDFGLAKSYVQTKSLMSMSGTRGTPGYIAPEVFCRGFGGASHKSDVYSYGMLVLDLVGCRKNSIGGSEETGSDLYFPHYIYKQFELKEDHELLGISNEEEKALQKKLVIVGLWCIQTNPSSRPSISRAVEMLVGDIESLQIPPIPFPSSPPKAYHQHDSSTNTATLESQLTYGSSE